MYMWKYQGGSLIHKSEVQRRVLGLSVIGMSKVFKT